MAQKKILLLDDPPLLLLHHGNEVRFMDLFRSTWSQIPERDRHLIREHWRGQELRFCELSDLWYDSNENYAQVTGNGYKLLFGATAFALMPQAVARFTIAHEMAHVLQKAQGKRPGGEFEEENEAEANSIAENWGFNRIAFLTFQMYVKLDGFEKACQTMQPK